MSDLFEDKDNPWKNPKHFIARRWEGWNERLLVIKGKHCDRYFKVKTLDDFAKVAIKIITERFKEGWYWKVKLPKPPEYTKEEANNLKERAKGRALSEIREYERILEEAQEHNTQYAWAEAVSKGDKVAAVYLMYAREGNEYEGFSFEDIEELS